MPVNIINAGISGTTAKRSLNRLQSQVLTHQPDLVIICFGLNDINYRLEEYTNSLAQIFEKCRNAGCDMIFMTPNMLNTYVAEDTSESSKDYAVATARYQNEGKMDRYISAAVQLAESMGVPVCNCYAKWKELSKTQDITLLLANRVNHPVSEMHELFAQSLYEMIMGEI